jgi:peptide chain release factor 1
MERVEARHAELTKLLTDGAPSSSSSSSSSSSLPSAPDPRELAKLSRELAALEQAMAAVRGYRDVESEVASLEALLHENGEGGAAAASSPSQTSPSERAELAKMAHEELALLRPALEERADRLIRVLLPTDEADDRSAILEVRMGVGGEEAALFAGELLKMYEAFAVLRGWDWKPLSVQLESDYGGVREAAVSVGGEGVFGALRHESGVHRVQRVPITQSTGKLQTSTATVAVLPEAEEVDVELRPADLRVDTYRAGGAGGQHVNTTDSAVRITHLPTGLVVAIQDERSQVQNRVKAMRVLRARIFELEREKIASARSSARKAQIGSSSRSERVRTYNFMQNRITDHRVGESKYDMAAFMRGEDLAEFGALLAAKAQEEALAELEAS